MSLLGLQQVSRGGLDTRGMDTPSCGHNNCKGSEVGYLEVRMYLDCWMR